MTGEPPPARADGSRPQLRVIETGDVIPLDVPVVVGRAPGRAGPSSRVLRVLSPDNDISRSHAEITVDGSRVVLRDLVSTNGTWVVHDDGPAVRLGPGRATVVEPGSTVVLAARPVLVVEQPPG